MSEFRTEYRIIGRFAKDTEPHLVAGGGGILGKLNTLEEADRELRQIQLREARDKKRGESKMCGGLVSTPYYSDYELLDLQIQSRQVSKWS